MANININNIIYDITPINKQQMDALCQLNINICNFMMALPGNNLSNKKVNDKLQQFINMCKLPEE